MRWIYFRKQFRVSIQTSDSLNTSKSANNYESFRDSNFPSVITDLISFSKVSVENENLYRSILLRNKSFHSLVPNSDGPKIRKLAVKNELSSFSNSPLNVSTRLIFIQLGRHRLYFRHVGFVGRIIYFDPCIRTLIVRNFQEVVIMKYSNIRTHICNYRFRLSL